MTKPQVVSNYSDVLDDTTTSYIIQGDAQVIQFVNVDNSYITDRVNGASIFSWNSSYNTYFDQGQGTHIHLDAMSIGTTIQNWQADTTGTIDLTMSEFPTPASVTSSLHEIPGYGTVLNKPGTLQQIVGFQGDYNVDPGQIHLHPGVG